MENASDKPARLEVTGSELRCVDDSGTIRWSVFSGNIVLVAEYTTDEGPRVDDYFLVFCTIEGDQAVFSSCTFYADDRDKSLGTLSDKLGSPLELELMGSTAWASRIVWPPNMAGQECFTFKDAEPRNVRERLRQVVLGGAKEHFLFDPVQRYIQAQLQARGRGRVKQDN